MNIRIPIWYSVKLVFVAWLVLPQFRGAAFIYEKYVRQQIIKYRGGGHHHKSPTGKGKGKFVDFIIPKKVSDFFICKVSLFEILCGF